MREVFYSPRGGEAVAFDRGWEIERYAQEQHYRMPLGPVVLGLTRYQFSERAGAR